MESVVLFCIILFLIFTIVIVMSMKTKQYFSESIFEKKHNYLNLILALMIPVGMHGLYNFSYTSELVTSQVANILLFVFRLPSKYSLLKKGQELLIENSSPSSDQGNYTCIITWRDQIIKRLITVSYIII